jgi:hypothetical protein
VKHTEVEEKGYLKIMYETEDCSPISVMCIKSVKIIYNKDDSNNVIVLRKDFSANVNNEDYDDLSRVGISLFSG